MQKVQQLALLLLMITVSCTGKQGMLIYYQLIVTVGEVNFVLQERLVDEFGGHEVFIFQFDGETREEFEVFCRNL